MKRILLFPDTNVFLQCRAFDELPWADSIDADEIELLIGAPVQDEIDRLKHDGNSRRARRARDANSLFRKVLATESQAITVRETCPRVVLRFAPPLPLRRETPGTLDLTRADDCLIDEVMHFRHGEPSAQILSDDTGMIWRSRRHDVPLIAVPESWMLPPEKDGRDKQIEALKAEVAGLRNAEPSLSVSIQDEGGFAVESISERMPLFADLADGEITKLTEEVQRRFPETKTFGDQPTPQSGSGDMPGLFALIQPMYNWRAPTQDQIQRYQKEYGDWIENVRGSFRRLGFMLNALNRIRQFTVVLANSGSRPADEVLFEMTSHGNVKLCVAVGDETPDFITKISKVEREASLRPPPTSPKGEHLFESIARNAELFGDRDILRSINQLPDYSGIRKANFHRDRHAFYRRDDDSRPSLSCSFTCEEFRHQREPRSFCFWIIVPAQVDNARSRLHVRVSARNLQSPVDLYVPIDIPSETQSTYAVAAKWRVQE
jgi:hypothetical protein